MATKQTVKIKVCDNEKLMGTLCISADNPFDSSLPEPVEPEKNITLDNIHIEEEFDNYTPIQYCIIPNKSSNIYLLEETEYTIKFKAEPAFLNKSDISVLDKLKNQKFPDEDDEKVKSKFTLEKVGDNYWYGNLNFKSYAGNIFIDISAEDFEYELNIGVRSKKLDYNEEYANMISDLAEYTSGLLFKNNALLYQSHEVARNKKDTKYEYYMLLEHIFRSKNLPAVFEYLSRNLYSILKGHKELVPTTFASNIGPAEIVEIITNPQDVHKTSSNHSIIEKNGQFYIPGRINETRYEDTIDTPENRFFKYFLEYLRNKIKYLLGDIENGPVKEDLMSFYNKVNYFLSQRFFRDISNMTYIPLNSQVLQKKEGYKQILKYFLMLELGTNITFNDVNDILKGYQKPLSTLYEYWCYFQLIKIVNKLKDRFLLIARDNVESYIDTEKWSLDLEKINILDYHFQTEDRKNVDICLMYHKSFGQSEKYEEDKSYSLSLDPDYSLLIQYEDIKKYIHFDAKYKVDYKNKNKYNSADVHKMHAYKDGIYDSVAAFILFPGENSSEKFDKHIGAIESVGAYCLKPGGNKEKNQEEIGEMIGDIIEEIIKPLKQKHSI